MFVVFRNGYRDEADVCDTLEEVRDLLNERFSDEPEYFQSIADEYFIYELGKSVPFAFEPARILIDVVSTPNAAGPVTDMLAVMELLERRNPREGEPGQSHSFVNGLRVRVKSDIQNDYMKDELPTIPAGSMIVLDFGGDFGLYGMTQIGEVLHKIKVKVQDLHLIDWTPFL